MIRLAIVGSSHVGAVRDAAPAITAAYPGIDLRFFAVPGGAFRRCRRNGQYWRADPQNPAEAALISRVNGAETLDLSGITHIWAIGHRFGYGAVLQGWIDGDGAAAMRAAVAASVDRIAAQWRAEPRLTLSPAPYPALRSRAPGPHHEPRMARIQRHPQRDGIFAEYEALVSRMIATADYNALLQPAATRAAAFATDNRYLQGARDFRDGADTGPDLRHMNADYGFALFQAFAADRLGLAAEG